MSTGRNNRGGRGHGPAQAAPVVPAPVKFTTLSKEYTQLGGTKFSGSEGISRLSNGSKAWRRYFLDWRSLMLRSVSLLLGNFGMPHETGGNLLLLVSRRTPSLGPSLGINLFGFRRLILLSIFKMLLI